MFGQQLMRGLTAAMRSSSTALAGSEEVCVSEGGRREGGRKGVRGVWQGHGGRENHATCNARCV